MSYYCEVLKIPHHFNNEKMRVDPELHDQATSAARLENFNKTNVESFFRIYRQILNKKIFKTGETTKSPSVLSLTGNHQMIKIQIA